MPRRLVVLLALSLAAVPAAAARTATPASSHFTLRLVLTAPGVKLVVSEAGVASGDAHLARFHFSATTGTKPTYGDAVIDSSSGLALYLHATARRPLPVGKTWRRFRGRAVSPMPDPGAALRIVRRGKPRTAGRRTVSIDAKEAALLVPGAAKPGPLVGSAWLDAHGRLLRFRLAAVLAGSSRPRITIDERFSLVGEPVQIRLPRSSLVIDSNKARQAASREDAPIRLVNSVLPALEAWFADKGTYAGATIALLNHTFHRSLDVKRVTIVRASRATYCVEATAKGLTAEKSGPNAPVVIGRC
jgi:hypothetical protein